MSSEYKAVKIGKLMLKGEKTKKHKTKKRKAEVQGGRSGEQEAADVEQRDTIAHGGWWKVEATHQIRGNVSIQMGPHPAYITALDDGLFTVGAPHDEGDGPSPEEILTVIPTGDPKKIAFKSGYDKYVGADARGRLVGRAEAIGPREMWTPVFEDGSTALLSSTECFVGIDSEDSVVATSSKAGTEEMITIRCSSIREKDKKDTLPAEEKGSLKDVEINYIKKFQKFQDKRMRVNPDGRIQLKEAKGLGKLHESLLDRRSKMKADRYCK